MLIGLDGAEPRLIEYLIEQGKLPNFKRIKDAGICCKLKSTIHPNTPPAWTSMITGMNPGRHGVFDFREKIRNSYASRFLTSESIKSRALWDILSETGRKVGIINVPLTYPPRPVNGFMVAGMHSPSLTTAIYPNELLKEIDGIDPGYQIDIISRFKSRDLFIKEAQEMAVSRARVALELFTSYQPDFFMCVFTTPDRVQHFVWDEVEQYLSGQKIDNLPGMTALYHIYKICDEFIGKMMDKIGTCDVLFVLSDHGFGPLEKEVYLNRYLIEKGYLKLLPSGGRGTRDPVWKPPPDCEAEGFDRVDWNNTQAYAKGFFGNIYLNVKEREPFGIVKPGAEYKAVRQCLMRDLYRMKDLERGIDVVDAVYCAEELYSGPYTKFAPDLILIMKNYAYMARDGSEFSSESLFSPPTTGHTGNHRLNGLFMAWGGRFNGLSAPARVWIADIAPTILSLLGEAVPANMDGSIISTSTDNKNYHIVSERQASDGSAADIDDSQPEQHQDEKQIFERLKALGYLH